MTVDEGSIIEEEELKDRTGKNTHVHFCVLHGPEKSINQSVK